MSWSLGHKVNMNHIPCSVDAADLLRLHYSSEKAHINQTLLISPGVMAPPEQSTKTQLLPYSQTLSFSELTSAF